LPQSLSYNDEEIHAAWNALESILAETEMFGPYFATPTPEPSIPVVTDEPVMVVTNEPVEEEFAVEPTVDTTADTSSDTTGAVTDNQSSSDSDADPDSNGSNTVSASSAISLGIHSLHHTKIIFVNISLYRTIVESSKALCC
jgi:hypothetical protein